MVAAKIVGKREIKEAAETVQREGAWESGNGHSGTGTLISWPFKKSAPKANRDDNEERLITKTSEMTIPISYQENC